ncbi:ATP-binding cassette domain-containing protein [Liquorilactobacillus nagelii]|uniref:ATP-binding cassette domain-containing protein n=1 Tax=Liquorilactobacillus nagelii TaxID=82688 RepID=UPI0011D146B6|nr:ATP-binding cassette domain-containing protein [Liquorilactobacillus nagelii]
MNEAILKTEHLSVRAKQPILSNINLELQSKAITAVIGPSGSGKTTLLQAFNRLNPRQLTTSGQVLFDGINIYESQIDCYQLRMNIGMLLTQPLIFPMTLKENLTIAPDLPHGLVGMN